MGSGKSTIGTLLSEKMALPFSDLDQRVALEDPRGRAAADLILEEGLEHFRELEFKALRAWLNDTSERGVLATGGGVVTQAGSIGLLLDTQIPIVWLHPSVEVLDQRTAGANQEQRPLLRGLNPEERLEVLGDLLQERTPLYRRAASWTIDSGIGDAEEVARMIERSLGEASAS